MLERSRDYHQEAEKINEVINRMTSLISELQTEWEGQASKSFENQFNELKPSFVNMHNLVETISHQLQQTGSAMQERDQDIASQFGVK
jgi:WXG100 family type VII secretion target